MADAKEPIQSVQTFGRKKNATAVAYCKRGKGLIKVNGRPLEQVEPKALQYKLQEPILLLGKDRFADVDIRIRVKGGGHNSQIYAIRQALSKSLVSYYQKCKSRLDKYVTVFARVKILPQVALHQFKIEIFNLQMSMNKAKKRSRTF